LGREEEIGKLPLVYLNRLSDYVYTLARYQNFKEKSKEEAWSR
jgi:cob(I)alamin adenosyltransferase